MIGKLSSVCVLLLAMSIESVPAIAGVDRDLVPDSATAIGIATIVLKTYLGNDGFAAKTKNRKIIAKLDGDDWIVYTYPESIPRDDPGSGHIYVVSGGGGPEIRISRHDAQVKDIHFSR